MQQNRKILNSLDRQLLNSRRFTSILSNGHLHVQGLASKEKTVAKYLHCSECGKLAFYYDDYVGTEKPFYKRFMRYPEGETKHEPPRCFNCGGVPRLIYQNIKEEKAAAKH
jgi:hypothetical protein